MAIHTLRHDEDDKRYSYGPSPSENTPTTFSDLYYSIPPVTRFLIISISITTFVYALQLVNIGYLIFHFGETFYHFQLWRIITSFLILPPQAMAFLMEIYNLFQRSKELETNHFPASTSSGRDSGNPSVNYVFYLCFCVTVTIVMTTLLYGGSYPLILTPAMTAALTVTWAIDNANQKVMFYGILPVLGKFFPLVQLGTSFVFGGGDLYVVISGMFAAYLYACLDTRTLGPVYGYVTGKDPLYGKSPAGKFGAPRFFVAAAEGIYGPAVSTSGASNFARSSTRGASGTATTSSKGLFGMFSKRSGGQRLGGGGTTTARAGAPVGNRNLARKPESSSK